MEPVKINDNLVLHYKYLSEEHKCIILDLVNYGSNEKLSYNLIPFYSRSKLLKLLEYFIDLKIKKQGVLHIYATDYPTYYKVLEIRDLIRQVIAPDIKP